MTHALRFFALVLLVAVAAPSGQAHSLAALSDAQSATSTFASAVSFDTEPPTIHASVVVSAGASTPGFVRAGGAYHVYAQVTDPGTFSSGVSSVSADVSSITSGGAAVALVAGSYTVGGQSYGYRSGSLTANGAIPEGARSYVVTARDFAGNVASRLDLTVSVDNTKPSGVDIQATNGGPTAGAPDLGDRVTLTFSEPIEPTSVLGGWSGAPTPVVVRITDGGVLLGSDVLEVRDAANTVQLPLGTVNLGTFGYVTATRHFGATGTPSTMALSGNTIVVTLGTPDGTTGSGLTSTMTWTPSAVATDRAGNPSATTPVTEGGSGDAEF